MNAARRIRSLAGKLPAALRKTGAALRIASFFLFGRFAWTPPNWLSALGRRVARQGRSSWRGLNAWRRAHPVAALTALGAMVPLIVVAVLATRWYSHRPPPDFVKVTLNGAAPMELKAGAKIDPLHVAFDKPCARIEDVGHPVAAGVRLDPPVPGAWRWVNDTQLDFQPTVEWVPGQEYVVTLDRSLLVAPRKLKETRHKFTTARFEATIVNTTLDEVPDDPADRSVFAEVRFTHPVDPAAFERALSLRWAGDAGGSASGPGAAIALKVSYDEFKGHAYVSSVPFGLPPEDAILALTVGLEARAARGGPDAGKPVAAQVKVPGVRTVFNVEDVALTFAENAQNELDRVLVVTTSLTVASPELLSHLKAWVLPEPVAAELVGPAMLLKSRPVELLPIPSDSDKPVTTGFRVDVPRGAAVFVRVETGLTGPAGFKLAAPHEVVLTADDYPRQLQIQHRGALLSLTGERRVSILARGVRKVRFTIGRVLPGRIQHLVTQTWNLFDPLQFRGRVNEDDLTEKFTDLRTLPAGEPGKPRYLSFDFGPYLERRGAAANQGVFFFNVEDATDDSRADGETAEDDESEEYAAARNEWEAAIGDKRLVLLTDLGLVVKEAADGSRDVFVQSIHTGEPVSGASVQVLGRNGIAIATAATDGTGHARFPNLASFAAERAATVWQVTRENDLAFLPFRGHPDRRLDLSSYETEGIQAPSPDTLSAVLFTDRGLYRPGETAHVAAIVKSASWRPMTGVPIELAIEDSRGVEVLRKRLSLSASGFETVDLDLKEDAPTGPYLATVDLVREVHEGDAVREETESLGQARFTVEEFVPDRMRIHASITTTPVVGWVKPDGLQGHVTLENLYGTPAGGHRVTAEITLQPGTPDFPGFKDFTFVDPLRRGDVHEFDLGEAQSDDAGKATFDVDSAELANATYRLTFVAHGFEARGGRGVTGISTVLVSPRPFLLGHRADGALGYVPRNGRRTLDLIAVDPNLKKVAVGDLTMTVLSRRYVSVLAAKGNGQYRYESTLREFPVTSGPLRMSADGTPIALRTDTPGDFDLVVQDAAGVELLRLPYTIAGASDTAGSREQATSQLEVRLDRDQYAPGDDIQLALKAPFAGAGLITIERERVHAWQWFTSPTPASVQHIRLPAGFEGNGYVVVTLLRAIDSHEVFTSPLASTVVPFTVTRDRRTVKVTLDTPEKVRPGDTLEIRHRADRPARIAVYAVDEGILQVARYKLPDPLSRFLEKQRLGVQTLQNLDLLLPEQSIVQAMSHVGGDEDAFEAGRHLNPFRRKGYKPVAFWSGIVETGPKERSFKIAVPDTFNGSVRVMAVAVAQDAVGVASNSVVVQSPLVLTPDAPLFVAPGDRFEVGATLEYLPQDAGAPPAEVVIEIDPTPPLEVEGERTVTVKVAAGRWVSVPFRMKAGETPGLGSFVLRAKTGKIALRFPVEVSIRPLTPNRITSTAGRLAGGTVDVPVPRRMFEFDRVLQASASVLPLGLARGLAMVLDDYPYECTEQVVSRAFAMLALRDQPELGPPAARAQDALDRALGTLQERQNIDGSFGKWAANGFVSDFQTVYALHFLTEAVARGVTKARPSLERGFEWLASFEPPANEGMDGLRTQAYAAYVLARNEKVPANVLASVRAGLKARFGDTWTRDLAAAYLAATYQILQQRDEADRLIAGVTFDGLTPGRFNFMEDRTVQSARLLDLVARHFPKRLTDPAVDLLTPLVDRVVGGGLTTLSSATAILALTSYARQNAARTAPGLHLAEVIAGGAARDLPLGGGLFPKTAFSPEASAVRVQATDGATVFYQVLQRGYDAGVPAQPLKNGIEVTAEYRGADGQRADRVRLGEEVEVRVVLRSLAEDDLADVVVVAPFPGGFELVKDPAPGQVKVDGAAWGPEFIDAREDRVLAFGVVGRKAAAFAWKLTAVTAGEFTTPPPFVESMYRPEVHGLGVAGRITVSDKL